ncbi:MAG: ARMT1-like domain-containing protein [Salinivirgaceae bacterium]|jgi:uncharacterized protein with ATP-grasp and redox domains|nr:ARMT1-like domain-containing protein [Salinivirgaceae bacterium]
MRSECILCHNKTVDKLIAKFNPNKDSTRIFKEGTSALLVKEYNNPYVATEIYRLARNILNNDDLYKEEKQNANMLLLKDYDLWKELIRSNKNQFKKAAKLAVAGNVIDYGAHSVPDEIEKQIILILEQGLTIDETDQLLQKVKQAKSILYLGDNAGEIVFDKLFIEEMNHPNTTYVVRDRPVINDVTFNDIEQIRMDDICDVISNGYDAPSTLLDFCSGQFLREYNNADLVISKGQGNFEGLMNTNNPKIFFMLMAKCDPMAKMLGVKKGDMVIKQLKKKVNGL